MKKFLLFIPIGLLAATGIFWVSTDKNLSSTQNTPSIEARPHGSQELFTDAQHSLRQIVRHGDETAIKRLNTSLDAITNELSERQKQGYALKDTKMMITHYKDDSALLINKFAPHFKELRQYDQFEQTHEKSFQISIEQIGLYELKTSYAELNKLRTDYIKEPSEQTKIAYEKQSDKVKQIITELYLDTAIDKPLFDYLKNHQLYFETIDAAYNDIGFEHIQRLRTTGYAIKTELQLLPTI